MIKLKAGLIAATPVDTAFGLQFLADFGIDGLTESLSKSPEEQTSLQFHNKETLEKLCLRKCLWLQEQSVNFIVIYCNSLSSTIDIEELRKELTVPVFTPFDVYEELAGKFNRFAIIAANSMGLLGIERFITNRNPNAQILGYENLEIVKQIENGKTAIEIIENTGLSHFLAIAQLNKADVLLPGCTHFSYILKTLIQIKTEKGYSFEIKNIDNGLKNIIQKNKFT